MFILKGYIMGLNVKEYRTKVEKTQNKTVQNKNYMSDTEKQEKNCLFKWQFFSYFTQATITCLYLPYFLYEVL